MPINRSGKILRRSQSCPALYQTTVGLLEKSQNYIDWDTLKEDLDFLSEIKSDKLVYSTTETSISGSFLWFKNSNEISSQSIFESCSESSEEVLGL